MIISRVMIEDCLDDVETTTESQPRQSLLQPRSYAATLSFHNSGTALVQIDTFMWELNLSTPTVLEGTSKVPT